MKKGLITFSIICAFALFAGETIILLTREKYWPLSLDDYLAVAALLYFVREYYINDRVIGLIAVYAYVVGNLYAMLFNRLDPVYGSGERIELLVIALLVAVSGLLMSWRVNQKIQS